MEETEDLLTVLEQKLIASLTDIGRLNIIDFQRCNGVWENNPVLFGSFQSAMIFPHSLTLVIT